MSPHVCRDQQLLGQPRGSGCTFAGSRGGDGQSTKKVGETKGGSGKPESGSFWPSREWGDHQATGTAAVGSDRSLRGREDTLHPRGHGKHLPTPTHTPSTSETEERSP